MSIAKVIYFSYDGMTDPLGQSQVMAYLKRLSKLNFHIDIVSFEKPEVYEKRKALIEQDLQGTGIGWHPLKYDNKFPVISTLSIINQGWRKFKELNQKHNYDIFHARAHVMAGIGLKAQKKYGTQFIFDMRGWWVDEKYESGNWNNPIFRPLYPVLKKQERNFFGKADYVVSLTEAGKDEILSKGYRKDGDTIGVIPTCVDFEIFKPFDPAVRSSTREELNIPDDAYVLIYSGSVGGSYSLDDIMSVYRQLLKLRDDAYFIILSKMPYSLGQEELSGMIKYPERVKILTAEFKEVYRYLQASDLGMIVYDRAYSMIGRSPTKLGEYWACGLPAISLSGVGDVDTILEKYSGGGVLIDDFNNEQIDRALTKILSIHVDKEVLRTYALDYYDIEKGVNFYQEIYEKLI